MPLNTRMLLRNSVAILILVSVINFALHLSGMYDDPRLYRKPYIAPVLDPNYSKLLIDTAGCKISNLMPDTKLYKYFMDVEPIECKDRRPPLFRSNYTSIYMIESALRAYGFSTKAATMCCYNPLQRKPLKFGYGPPPANLHRNDCVLFNYSTSIPHEYVKVLCYNVSEFPSEEHLVFDQSRRKKKYFYMDFFYFVKRPRKLEGAEEPQSKVNVLILGTDSMSRINFKRQMPKTYGLLNDIGAIEFFGYNKIAENTFGNVLPMLSGNSSQEVLDSCIDNKFFDKCTLIWQHYKAQGYATAFIEDSLVTGLFRYDYRGFREQPTDYYWNVFYSEADKAIGNININIVNYCFGSRKVHEILLEYLERFVTVMDASRQAYFGHFWQSVLTHNDFNQAQNGDIVYKEVVNYLYQGGHLNNTVLFFMSDHGNRIDKFRKTYAGMVEDRLPFLFVRLPDWMATEYPRLVETLQTNSARLVTTYDIHETLMQLTNPDYSKLLETDGNAGNRRGYSLFSPITANRTCETACIPEQWCLCQSSTDQEVDEHDEAVEGIVEYMIAFINDGILRSFKMCERLTLSSIPYARKSVTRKMSDLLIYNDFTVAFITLPSEALFEGSIRRITSMSGRLSSLLLSGDILRLNTYYHDSLCVADEIAKRYCFCSYLLH